MKIIIDSHVDSDNSNVPTTVEFENAGDHISIILHSPYREVRVSRRELERAVTTLYLSSNKP